MGSYIKAFDIYGYVGDACLVCHECWMFSSPEDAPVFASDVTEDDSCDLCLRKLLDIGPA